MTGQLNVGLILKATDSGFTAVIRNAKGELVDLAQVTREQGAAALAGAADMRRASQQQAEAQHQVTRSHQQTAAAAREAAEAQRRWNEALGIRSPAAGRGEDVKAYGQALDGLRAKFVPLFALQQAYKARLDEIRQAHRVGAINVEEQAQAIGRAKTAFAGHVQQLLGAKGASEGHAGAVKLQAWQVNNLVQQIQDVAVQLGSGTNPFTIMLQQGPQITSALGGVGNSVKLLLSPLALMAGGFAAAAGAIAVVLAAGESFRAGQRQLAVDLLLSGNAIGLSVGQLDAYAEAATVAGHATVQTYREVAGAVARIGVGEGTLRRILALSDDLARVTGEDLAQAAQKLAESLKRPLDGALQLDRAYNLLTDAELQHIRRLQDQGRLEEARAIVLDRLGDRIKGAAEQTSIWARAWNAVAQGAAAAWEWLGKIASDKSLEELLAKQERDVETARTNPRVTPQQRALAERFLEELRERKRQQAAENDQRSQADKDRQAVKLAGETLREVDDVLGLAAQIQAKLSRIEGGLGKAGLDAGAAAVGELNAARLRQQLADLKSLAPGQTLEDARRGRLLAAERGVEGLPPAEQERRLAGMREEISLLGTATTAEERSARARDATAQVVTQQTRGISVQAAALAVEHKATLDVAGAYLQSAAAGERAEAMRQARLESLTTGVDVQTRAQELLRQSVDRTIESGAKAVEGYESQAAAAERMAGAATRGASVQRMIEAANKAQIATLPQVIALESADAEQRLKLWEIIERATAAIFDQARAEEAVAAAKAEQMARRDHELAQMERQVASIADPNLRRAMELQIERQRKINELTDEWGTVAEGTGKKLLDLYDQAAAEREIARFYDDVRDGAEDLSRDVSQFLKDGFANVGKAGGSVFKNLWDGALAGGRRFLLDIAAEFLRQKIILPIAMSVVGSIPGAFGIASPQGRAGGGFDPISWLTGKAADKGLDSLLGGNASQTSFFQDPLGSIAGIFKNVFSPDNFIANAFPGLFGAGGAIAGFSSGAISASAAAFAAEGTLGGAFAAGGMTAAGPLAGMASFLPAIGFALAAIPLLLSGMKKPSVGPNSNATIGMRDGSLDIIDSGADNGGDLGAARQLADRVSTSLQSIVDQLGGTISDAFSGLQVGIFKNRFFVDDTRLGGTATYEENQFSDEGAAVADAVRRALKSGLVTGLGQDVTTALRNTTAKTFEELQGHLTFADRFRDSIALMNAGIGTFAEQALKLKIAAEEAAKAQASQVKTFIETTDKLFKADASTSTTTRTVQQQLEFGGDGGGSSDNAQPGAPTLYDPSAGGHTYTVLSVDGDNAKLLDQATGELVDATRDAATGLYTFSKSVTDTTAATGPSAEGQAARQAVKNQLLAELGLYDGPAALDPAAVSAEPLEGWSLALATATAKVNAMRPALEAAGFTAEEIADIIPRALAKAREKVVEEADKAASDQLLALRSPAAAQFKALTEAQDKRRGQYTDIGADLGVLGQVEQEELKRFFSGLDGEGIAQVVRELAALGKTAEEIAPYLAEARAKLNTVASDQLLALTSPAAAQYKSLIDAQAKRRQEYQDVGADLSVVDQLSGAELRQFFSGLDAEGIAEVVRELAALGKTAEEIAPYLAEARAKLNTVASDQLLALTSPAAAQYKSLIDAQAKRRQEYQDVGADLSVVDQLSGAELRQFFSGLDAEGIAQVTAHLQALGQTAADLAPIIAEATQKLEAQKAAELAFDRLGLQQVEWQTQAASAEQQLTEAREAAISAIQAEIQAQEEAEATYSRVASTLRKTREDLALDRALSPFGRAQQLTIAELRYNAAKAAIGGTDEAARLKAMEEMPDLTRRYLELSKETYDGTAEYYRRFSEVQGTLLSTETVAERHALTASIALGVARQQLAAVEETNRQVGSVAQALANLAAANTNQQTVSQAVVSQQRTAFTTLAANFVRDYGMAGSSAERDATYQRYAGPRDSLIGSILSIPLLNELGQRYYPGDTSDAGALEMRRRIRELGGVPAFIEGGRHRGGLRLVGEGGPEIEATGSAQIWSSRQTRQMLAGAGADGEDMVKLLRLMVDVAGRHMRMDGDVGAALMQRLDKLERQGREVGYEARLARAA